MVFVGVSLLASCKKAEKDALSSASKSAEQAMKFGITNGINLQTNARIMVAAETLSKDVGIAITNETYLEMIRAGAFLKLLHEQGRLPGISKEEHGDMTSDTLNLVVSNRAIEPIYPMARTFHLIKYGDTSTNNYTLVKQSINSEWELQRAWLTDSNGQTIQEWSVQ